MLSTLKIFAISQIVFCSLVELQESEHALD